MRLKDFLGARKPGVFPTVPKANGLPGLMATLRNSKSTPRSSEDGLDEVPLTNGRTSCSKEKVRAFSSRFKRRTQSLTTVRDCAAVSRFGATLGKECH